jgi:ABC-type transport system substrate-binding protein
MRRSAVGSLAILVTLLLVAACGGGDDESGDDSSNTQATGNVPTTEEALEPQDGGTLVFAVEADSDGYHPINSRWSISGNYVGSSVFEPLMVEVGDGSLEPWLAESVTPNDDATEWTIVTKDGITFHDGTPFDADAVVANIQARLESPLTSLANRPIESVEKVDDHTAVVHMKTPWSGYDHTLAAVGGYMAAPAMLEVAGGDPTKVIGTGPFVFDEWVPGDHFSVTRYDDYWRTPVHLDGITFRFLPDVTTRAASLESGDVDAIITPQPSAIKNFRDADGIVSFEHASEPFHVMLNSGQAPFDNPTLRQALAYGTNRDAVIAALDGEDVLEPADSPFLENNPWHLADSGYPEFDEEKATELVQEYEDETGEDARVTIKGSSGQEEALAGALVEQWRNIGVDASFESIDQATLISQIVFGDYQAVLWRSHNWVDPDFNYIFWHSSYAAPLGELSINFTHLENDELDAALDAGRSTLDPDARREAYDTVQRVLNQELTHLWLFGQVWDLASKDTVHGWQDLVDRGLSRLEPKVVWGDVWMEQ